MALRQDSWRGGLESRVSAIEDEVGRGETSRIDALEGGMPPLMRATVTVPEASVATLNSVPFTLVAGVTGKVIAPEALRIDKAAGTAWTVGTSGPLRVAYTGLVTLNPFAHANQTVTTNFFNSTAVQTWLAVQPLDQIGVQWPATHDLGGVSLILLLATADIADGTGDLTVTVWYREWDEVA